MKKEKKYLVYILLFYVLNILNTYFVTTAKLNRYLTSFTRTVRLELNAIIGNFGVLTIILFLGFSFIKTYKKRSYYMIIVTFLLNLLIFLLGIFSKYYQTIFSLYEMTLFKNPAQALGLTIVFESLKELFLYYRIIVFAPTIIMIAYHYYLKFKKEDFYDERRRPIFSSPLLNNIIVIAGLILSMATLSIFNVSMTSNWRIFAERPLYGVQNSGLYNYYFGQLMGFRYDDEYIIEINPNDFKEYNKNKENYTNLWGEPYSNKLNILDASTVILDESIETQQLNGIFEDKNLVLIHLESFNSFLLEERGLFDETYFPFLKSLLEESYVLENFYTNVGLGTSSDAEFSVMTGLHVTGNTTLYWKYHDNNYTFDALPKLFTDRDSYSFHGDVAEFYNRVPVHEEMFGFKAYYYFDREEEYVPGTKNGCYLFKNQETSTPDAPWVSDKALLSWAKEVYDRHSEKKLFLYPINYLPHTPFLYDEFASTPRFTKADVNIDTVSLRYINYEASLESYFRNFIEIAKTMKNTVYIFYGDHGSGIIQKDFETILGYDTPLNPFEYNRQMLKTLAFIYVPDDNDTESEIPRGLLKGRQPKVRSQVDIYRTIIELFDLKADNYYYGVNLLSDESTFSIDTRNFSIVTDDFYIVAKRFKNSEMTEKNTIFYNDNPRISSDEILEYVYLYKQRVDKALRNNVHYLLRNEE
ncbi:MAG: sulfatase-like hydrolase/transferase [Acholeplasmataceae bacterium]|nr:sulfatase-like hydrolase/transferase [Acholeplasmataceae bacterium]